MILETERLLLRPWEVRDAKDLYEYAKDPQVGPITGWPVHTSVRESRGILKNALIRPETYAVTLKGSDHPIGSVCIFSPARVDNVQPGEMEIGCWLGVPFWGHGYIPEAIARLQKHAFEDLDCTALWYGWYDGNVKSDRCREKCGFTYHHTEKDRECLLMHELRTEHFARLTREEWLRRSSRTAAL